MPLFSRTDRRAIEVAAINAGIPQDVGISAVLASTPDLDVESIEAYLIDHSWEPVVPAFVANLISSGVLFDLTDVPPAELDEYDVAPEGPAGTTSTASIPDEPGEAQENEPEPEQEPEAEAEDEGEDPLAELE